MDSPLPGKKQLEFLDWQMGVFFHFGIRTFYEGHRDWDGLPMDPSRFDPSALDCEDWIRAVRDFGGKYAILTCKHHDGFANWPSAYTDFGVKRSPWKNGQGDVVREFTDACRKYGIKIGLYYSPAQAGYEKLTAAEYDDYFINQIGELLQNYGTIDYLWFDGCGSEDHVYDRRRIVAAIRGYQPDILIFNMWDPDTRWVGNEKGIAAADHSNIVDSVAFSVLTDRPDSLGGSRFLPAECDCMMRESNWFYSEYDSHTVKSVTELMGMYCHSVGRGANLLINIGPDRRGLLPEVDKARLLEFGEAIRERFGKPLPGIYTVTEDGGKLALVRPELIDRLVVREDLTQGEGVAAFAVEAVGPRGNLYTLHVGSTVGHMRVIEFPPVRVTEVRVKVIKRRRETKITGIAAYYTR